MVRIIPKSQRRVAVVIIVISFFIGLIFRFDFWYVSKTQQNILSAISLAIMMLSFLYLIMNTNIWKLASPYNSNIDNLDERELSLQLETYHKAYRILDFVFAITMVFIYFNGTQLSTNYPKLGWLIVMFVFLLIRLLPIIIIAWTEEEI